MIIKRITLFAFLLLFGFRVFPQKVIYDTVSVIEYQYDTVYKTIKHIDTSKAITPFIKSSPNNAVSKPKLSIDNIKYYPFFSLEYSQFSILKQKETVNGISYKQNNLSFPCYRIIIGIIRGKWLMSANAELKKYSEQSNQSIPFTVQDTLDNGNEIYYRNIQKQKTANCINQYRYCSFYIMLGRLFSLKHFSISPQLQIGFTQNIKGNLYGYDTLSNSITTISNKSSNRTFVFYGAECPLGYVLNNRIQIYLNPYFQSYLIDNSKYPKLFSNTLGIGIGLTYMFNNKSF